MRERNKSGRPHSENRYDLARWNMDNREHYDDEFPISPNELDLIRRDTEQAQMLRELKPPNFAGERR